MGGTSTDVTHFAGEYERSFDTEVAGVRMRAPMMNIHTVAAGGGSILSFDGGRFRVGPGIGGRQSGPACYRRGGPLTVTDCNVCSASSSRDYFPQRLRPERRSAARCRQSCAKNSPSLRREVAEATGQPACRRRRLPRAACGSPFENMANAIKKISVQRGYDVSGYALQCFGGAGGQHACLVADALGMETIFMHPFAGVLSAYGMGLADLSVMREQAVDLPLDGRERGGSWQRRRRA